MNIKETAVYLGIHEKTLRRWLKQGKVSGKKTVGPHGEEYSFTLADIEAIKNGRKDETLHHPEVTLSKSEPENVHSEQDNAHPTTQESSLALPVQSERVTMDILKALSLAIQGSKHERLTLDNAPELLTVDQVAEVLGCGKSKVLSLLREDELRGIKGIGRGWKIKKDDLRLFLEEL